VRVRELPDPQMKKIPVLGKMVHERAKRKAMEKERRQ